LGLVAIKDLWNLVLVGAARASKFCEPDVIGINSDSP
jgi:hypothetical protein